MTDIDNLDTTASGTSQNTVLPGIDIVKYIYRLKAHWKAIILWAVAGFVLGCVVALLTPRRYEVVTKLAPELSSTATNRMSSLASLVGMSSTVMGTTDAVYPMVYPDILRSPEFLVDLFDVTVMYQDGEKEVETTLYDYMTTPRKTSMLSLPGKLIEAIMGIFSPKQEDEAVEEIPVNSFHLTRKQGMILNRLSNSISSEVDKKTMSLTIKVTMNDALVCATLARAIDKQLWQYVTDYRTEKAQRDCDYFDRLCKEAQEEYYEALTTYFAYLDTHQDISFQRNMIEKQKLKNESDLKYQLYNSMAQQLQSARAKVQQETPVFAELVPPTVPLKSANSRRTMAMAFAFIGFLAGVVVVLFKK